MSLKDYIARYVNKKCPEFEPDLPRRFSIAERDAEGEEAGLRKLARALGVKRIPLFCTHEGCKRSAIGATDKCLAHGGGKRCTQEGCKRSAIGATDKCSGHGGGKRCTQEGCKRGALSPNDKCRAHGGGKRCTEKRCKRSAQGRTDKCMAHGGGKRCTEKGCKRGAEGGTDKCKAHGGGKRCTHEGCKRSARSPTDKCSAHGGGKRCTHEGCKRSALSPTDKCSGHGGGKRCTEEGCNKSAQGGTDKCKAHGGGKRCPNCVAWIDSRCGSSKYDGYCATCFKRVFPQDPRSTVIYEHTKEIRVRNALNARFPEQFVHDRPIYTHQCDCTHRRRIDHRKLIGSTMLAIETDEFGHRSYDQEDEVIRYDDLYMVHSGKWVFVRFNPDGGRGTDLEDMIDVLLQEVEDQMDRIEQGENSDLVEIVKLYY